MQGLWDSPGSPVVGTSPSTEGGAGSIPGQGTRIPHVSQPKNQNIKQKQYCSRFNKVFENDPYQKKKREMQGLDIVTAPLMSYPFF